MFAGSDIHRLHGIWNSADYAIPGFRFRASGNICKFRTTSADWSEVQPAESAKWIARGLTEQETVLAKEKLPVKSGIKPEYLDGAERKAAGTVDEILNKQCEGVADQQRCLVRLMEATLCVDTGAPSDMDTDDVHDYLKRLRVLIEESLPNKLSRFLGYLNRSSDQGISHLPSIISSLRL
ncbi:MAG: hypothetical protein MK110_12900 [Fuerstiella sp.]|nr:hypothetical protein [Fuerstiella sp.]